MNDRFYIAIEGVIGVGKTTLARLIKDRFHAQLLLEVFEENPFLSAFYSDRARYAFQTQLFFLLSRYRQQNSVVRQTLEQATLISDYSFAKDRLFAHLNLAGDELEMYDRVHAALAQNIPLPDLIVFLRADTDMLMNRIASRDRSYERDMSRQYIDDLRVAYEHFFSGYRECPVLPVDTNDLDIVANPDDLSQVVSRIRPALEGRAYQPRLLHVEGGPSVWGVSEERADAWQAAGRGLPRQKSDGRVCPPWGDLYYLYLGLTNEVGQLGAGIAGMWAEQNRMESQVGNVIEARQLALQEGLPQIRAGLIGSLKRLVEIARLTDTDIDSMDLD